MPLVSKYNGNGNSMSMRNRGNRQSNIITVPRHIWHVYSFAINVLSYFLHAQNDTNQIA